VYRRRVHHRSRLESPGFHFSRPGIFEYSGRFLAGKNQVFVRLSGILMHAGQGTAIAVEQKKSRKGTPMTPVEDRLAQAFHCPKCNHHGARVERRAMSGTGITRFFEVQPYRYAFVSCSNCGYTEIYDLRTLEGKDDLGTFLEILFMD
jgi:predicted nucleic-acid-binding Zn-ribbon protein